MVDRCDENVNSTLNHSSDSVKTTATLQTKDEDGRVPDQTCGSGPKNCGRDLGPPFFPLS